MRREKGREEVKGTETFEDVRRNPPGQGSRAPRTELEGEQRQPGSTGAADSEASGGGVMVKEMSAEREVVRPERVGSPEINLVADPAPLGLGGFAATTFLLSLVNAGILDKEVEPVVFPLALLYGGIAQILAGLWEFRNNRNTFGATAFTTYGAFWLTFYFLVTSWLDQIPESSHPEAVGTYLLVWTIFTLYMWVGTFRLNGALMAVFTFLLATFALLTVGAYSSTTGITELGGWFGVVTALLAWYTAAAIIVNTTHGRTILPVWPKK
jgi:hypothetical protein